MLKNTFMLIKLHQASSIYSGIAFMYIKFPLTELEQLIICIQTEDGELCNYTPFPIDRVYLKANQLVIVNDLMI